MCVLKLKIVRLEDGLLYMTELIEGASGQLICKLLRSPRVFLSTFTCTGLTTLCLGTCLDVATEDHWVNKRITALERVLANTDTFWSDGHCCQAVVRLQDHAQHIEDVVQGCQRALTTMFSVMLPRNPFLENFHQLLDTFRSSDRIHHLIKLNLVAGANFALAWIRKWKP
jgi:hypothetical protein